MVQQPQPPSHPGKTSHLIHQIRQQMAMVHRYHSSGINLLVITLRFLFVSASQDPADAYNIISCPETSQLAKSLIVARFYGLQSLRTKADNTMSDTVIIGQDPNKVYTRFLCRGDDSRQVCRDCVQNAIDVTKTQCNGTHALIWYDRCLVRYSVTSFFTDDSEPSFFTVCNPVNISNSIAAEFMDMVNKTMYSVANRTANNAVKKFETSVVNFSASTTLYVLEQCWPEKSDSECYQCLTGIVDEMVTKCDGRRDGKGLVRSDCTAWYSSVLFFDQPQPQVSILAPQVSILAPVRPRTKATHPGIAKSTKITGTVTAVVASVSLLVIAVFILRRKRKDDYERESIELLTVESLQYNLVTLQNATNNFSDKNKIGRDHEKQGLLDWKRRYNIIQGIARGLLYLHEDSRLRIIHRDLKASNILLDADMNPKVSDFGTARLVSMDQSMNETLKVAGTLGYMAPEYISHGQFSVKSDVYSFGVLVLEIISGKQVRNCSQSGVHRDLLNYAWKLWRTGNGLEFMDPTLMTSYYSAYEVTRCIQLGLLCIQPDMHKRPSMSVVVNTLSNLSYAVLPDPQEPALFNIKSSESSSSTVKREVGTYSSSSKSMTELTVMDPR
ncbi:hypothetical protein Drorol1_Dr00010540 [Drosera rotundifolia]